MRFLSEVSGHSIIAALTKKIALPKRIALI